MTKKSPNEFAELKQKINNLEKKVVTLEGKVEELESYKKVSEHVNMVLSQELDALNQYSRRSNIVMRNIWLPENETNDQLTEKVSTLIKDELNLPSAVKDIDKLHRIGPVKEKNGKKHQNVIIRFRSHKTRYNVFREKKKLKHVKISANLTKKRGKLLHEAIEFVESINEVDYVFADIHGDLKVKVKKQYKGTNTFKFETFENLKKLLIDMDIQ